MVRKTFQKPIKINSPEIPLLQLPNLEELNLKKIEIENRAAIQFKGGETEALKRLKHYFYDTRLISKYKETRNEMVGIDYSSKFSARLSMGCISSRYIYSVVKKYELQFGSNVSTYWLIFELLWRDFFRSLLLDLKDDLEYYIVSMLPFLLYF